MIVTLSLVDYNPLYLGNTMIWNAKWLIPNVGKETKLQDGQPETTYQMERDKGENIVLG